MTTTPPLRRPLMGITCVYIAGTAVGVCALGWLGFPALASLAGVCLGLALILSAWPRLGQAGGFARAQSATKSVASGLASVLFYIALFFCAWSALELTINDPSPRALSALMMRPRESMEIRGIVHTDPVHTVKSQSALWRFNLQVSAIRRLADWQPAEGLVTVTLTTVMADVQPRHGDQWALFGVLTDHARVSPSPSGAQARPALEWIQQRYAFAADARDARCERFGQGAILKTWSYAARHQASQWLALGIGDYPDVIRIMRAFLLGYRENLSERLQYIFTATGTLHIFAISGQHVAVIASFLVVLLQMYRVTRTRWFWYVMPLLVLFTLATGLSASAVRGCLMGLACFLGPWLWRRTDLPSALALSALLILGWDPSQLFNYGFILSFGVVAALIGLCPPLVAWVAPALETDPWQQTLPPFESRIRQAFRATLFLVISSASAWLASTPLIARWFNLVSPIALVANLLIIPLSSLTLLSGCLAIVFGGWAPTLASTFNFATVALVSLMVEVTDLLARVPGGHQFVMAPSAWCIGIWYALLVAWIVWHQHRIASIIVPLGLAALFIVPGYATVASPFIAVLNAGGTPVCYLSPAGGRNPVLIHSGPRHELRALTRFLRQQGVNRLESVILPFPDAPHAGALPSLLSVIPARQLWLGASDLRSKTTRALLSAATNAGMTVNVLSGGDTGHAAGPLDWTAYPTHRSRQALVPDAQPVAVNIRLQHCQVQVLTNDTLRIQEVGSNRAARIVWCATGYEPGSSAPNDDGALLPGESIRMDSTGAIRRFPLRP